MLKCYKVHAQKAADLATLGPFQQLETVLLLFLIANIVITNSGFNVMSS